MKCKQHKVEQCPQCFGGGANVGRNLKGDPKAQKFGLDNERVIYISDELNRDAEPFLASNEFGWPGLPSEANRLEAGVAICVGSNMGWDQALENKCKALVVFDCNPSIAQIHEWVYRPLLLNSMSPLDFLEALCCFPIRRLGAAPSASAAASNSMSAAASSPTTPPNAAAAGSGSGAAASAAACSTATAVPASVTVVPTAASAASAAAMLNASVFNTAEGVLRAHDVLFSDKYAKERSTLTHEFRELWLETVTKSAAECDVSPLAVQCLGMYFAAICASRGCKVCKSDRYPFELGHFTPRMKSANNDLSKFLLSHFADRYLNRVGLRDSWASSPMDFARLKSLMHHHLYYVIGDLFNPRDEVMWRLLGETFRFPSWSINVSNVIDYVSHAIIDSRYAHALEGLAKDVHQRYKLLSLKQRRLRKLLEIDAIVRGVHPLLATILYYYTVGGMTLRDGHTPNEYIHFSGVPVAFDGLP